MIRSICLLAFALLISVGTPAQNFERIELELESGNLINVTKFFGGSESLIIWIPSERGIREGYIPVARNTLVEGMDIWALDLHSSYMVPKSRQAFEEFEVDDIVGLMEVAMTEGFKRIMLVSAGRGAPFVLHVGRKWQETHPNSRELVGYGFIHPHFLDGTPEMGEAAKYLPITYATNLPVYLLQPEFSTKFARTREIVDALSQGGSKVFVHPLKGVRGGFHTKSEHKLKEKDLEARARLPELFTSMMDVMDGLAYPTAPTSIPQPALPPPPMQIPMPVAGQMAGQIPVPAPHRAAFREPQLHPFKGNPEPPATILEELNGEAFDMLASTRGEVVLVNFWATWCGPCIKEIPSLKRLVDRMKGKPFRVVAINIGEPRSVINGFIRTFDINFPILLDTRGDAVRDWNVYAYPSNFLLDQNGKIRYAYRGALEWDADNIVETIENTLAEQSH